MKTLFNSIEDVFEYIDKIPKFKDVGKGAFEPGLTTIKKFCKRIGNPQTSYESIHVAGTNGKGTTCYLLSEAYIANGYNVGLYSSPHLIRYNERVKVNGVEISDEALIHFFNLYGREIEELSLSYFEISTALAFWFFAESKVDIAIVETGLGGRLDATNIILPSMSIITSISLDHTDVLGDSIEQIAYEKAGIIKDNTPVVVGALPEPALDVVSKQADLNNSSLKGIQLLSASFEATFTIQENEQVIDFGDGLKEPINRFNYAIAWTALSNSSLKIDRKKVIEAWKTLKPLAGRFEKIGDNEWYFCGAHNPESYTSLMDTISLIGDEPIIIFTSMKDKLNKNMIKHLSELEEVYYFQLEGSRVASFSEIEKLIPNVQNLHESEVLNKLNDLRDVLVIFTGSFYFYDTVKHWTGQFVT